LIADGSCIRGFLEAMAVSPPLFSRHEDAFTAITTGFRHIGHFQPSSRRPLIRHIFRRGFHIFASLFSAFAGHIAVFAILIASYETPPLISLSAI
jgi:hypothetical protein